MRCGKPLDVLGDAFIARFYDDGKKSDWISSVRLFLYIISFDLFHERLEDNFRRLDFRISELSAPSSGEEPAWIVLAQSIARRGGAKGAELSSAATSTTDLKVTGSSSGVGAGVGLGRCVGCGSSGSLRCSRCKSVIYCSQACQRTHWKSHKKNCVAPISS